MDTRRFKNGTEIDVYNKNDILDLIDDSAEDKEIMNDIITSMMAQAIDGIQNYHSISIPYTMILQRTTYNEFSRNHAAEISNIRRNNTKEEGMRLVRELYGKERTDIINKRVKYQTFKRVMKKNTGLYKKYARLYGLVYADTYIYCLSLCTIVKFDQEVEDALQLLNK